MKTLFLHQILQVTLRLSIEDSKVPVFEISKLTLGLYFETFLNCIPITQNPVFRQLVPFDMLSHILKCTINFTLKLYYTIVFEVNTTLKAILRDLTRD